MRRALRQSLVRNALVLSAAAAAVGCSSGGTSDSQGPSPIGAANDRDDLGSVGMQLTLPGGQQVNTVSWTITGPNGASTVAQSGLINVQNSLTVSFTVGNIPAGNGYTITVSGSSADGSVSCLGSAGFDVATHATTNVSFGLQCSAAGPEAGTLIVNGSAYSCATVTALSALPAETTVGHSVAVSGAATGPNPTGLTYAWSAPSGSLDTPAAAQANYTCAASGPVTLTMTVSDGAVFDGGTCSVALATQTVQVQCDAAIASEAGAPPDAGTTPDAGTSPHTIDLSRYVRVARYDLPEPTRTTPPDSTSLLAQEASTVTYDWDTDTLFVVGDGGTSVVQVSKTGALIDSMTLAPGGSPQGTEFYDTEGVSYVGGGKFVMVEERYRQVNLFTYVPGATLHRTDAQTVKLGTTIGNIGLEGVTWDPKTGDYIFVKEKDPRSIFESAIDFAAGTASNGSPTTDESVDLFDPNLVSTLDFSDVFALSNLPSLSGDPTYDQLLIISQESAKIVQVDRSGNVKHTLTMVADPSDTISVPDMTMEGVTMDRNGTLYVAGEDGGGDVNHPQLWVYVPSTAPDLAPTAVSLTGAVTTLPESTSTLNAVKLADIFVADDGIGDNNLSVSGPDAASFQIVGTALFLKAGTTLSAAAHSSYDVTVDVDDPTVGATPDASTPYTLAITPASSGGAVTLAVTEVAPWSSGNSPLAADWFELTNFGSASVSLVGWTMDDNSNSFAVSVPLSGVATIKPGESVIFIETASSSDLATVQPAFVSLWYGGTAPAGLQIGTYSGSGVGLSTGGDAVNVFDNGGAVQAAVSFGASPSGTPLATFDNSAGLDNVVISNLSVVGQFGAFVAPGDSTEIGSPGTVGSGGTPIVGITAVDGQASETGSDPGVFRFTRSGSTTSPMTVVYTITTGAGQATSGDYTPTLTGSQIIPAGAASVDVTITPVDDALVEGTEQLTLTLSDTGNYDVGSAAAATVTILDNDTQAVAPSGIVISEVAPWSSSNSPLAADWFEVTNTSSAAVDITGWKMDDNSHTIANAVALNGITSIAPGEAVIFIESADLPTASSTFRNLWFGSNPQRVTQIGAYEGSGVGLSSSADEVALFDAAGNLVAGVGFGASPTGAFATFDNHAGVNGTTLPLPILSTLSATGVNGAFVAAGDANEVGSPGIGNVGKLIVTEVAPWASSNSPYMADWFEVTNVGGAAVDMTGWKMDDNSNSFSLAVPIVGIGSVAPGQSVILIEGTSTTATSFVSAWFGGSPPAGFVIGSYTGSGVGLSTSGDAVNLFNTSGAFVTGVQFGNATTGFSFDNTAGLATVTTLSVAGTNGAFLSPDNIETGSPGRTH
jgi:uncharacterized protein YjiK